MNTHEATGTPECEALAPLLPLLDTRGLSASEEVMLEEHLAGRVVDGNRDADDGDEILADAHHDGTPDEQRPPSEALDAPHAGERHEHVDDVRRDLGEEGVLDAGVLEEGRAV